MLAVDDESMMLNMVASSLEQFGYGTVTASGHNAVRALPATRPLRIDLLLTDVSMPDEDGVAFAKWLLEEQHSQMKVLYMTGDIHGREPLADLNTIEVIEKPFKPPELIKRIRELLDQ